MSCAAGLATPGEQDYAQPEHETCCPSRSRSLYTPGHPRRFYAEIDRRHDCSPAWPCLNGVRDVDGEEPGDRQTRAAEADDCRRDSNSAHVSSRGAVAQAAAESLDSGLGDRRCGGCAGSHLGAPHSVLGDTEHRTWYRNDSADRRGTAAAPRRRSSSSTPPVTCSAIGVAGVMATTGLRRRAESRSIPKAMSGSRRRDGRSRQPAAVAVAAGTGRCGRTRGDTRASSPRRPVTMRTS